jgi:hypothetical protein
VDKLSDGELFAGLSGLTGKKENETKEYRNICDQLISRFRDLANFHYEISEQIKKTQSWEIKNEINRIHSVNLEHQNKSLKDLLREWLDTYPCCNDYLNEHTKKAIQ